MKLAYRIAELTIDELVSGIKLDQESISCVVCGEAFEPGRIYKIDGDLYDARRAATGHIAISHGGMLPVLAGLPKEQNGLTDVQRNLVARIAEGASDREIARESSRAESTIRNQRFHLNRRVSEASVICAIGRLLETVEPSESRFVSFHDDIPGADDRIVITRTEEEAILAKFITEGDRPELIRLPKKQKEWLVVLKRISAEFEPGTDYTEREVNEILTPINADYVTLRRYLIEYLFLERERGGKRYWLHGTASRT